jgi:hypothetical protein
MWRYRVYRRRGPRRNAGVWFLRRALYFFIGILVLVGLWTVIQWIQQGTFRPFG